MRVIYNPFTERLEFINTSTVFKKLSVETGVVNEFLNAEVSNKYSGFNFRTGGHTGFMGLDYDNYSTVFYYGSKTSGMGVAMSSLAAIINPKNLDYNFIIRKKTSGEAYRFDAGANRHDFSSVVKHISLESKVVFVNSSSSVDLRSNSIIEQTVAGITTSLSYKVTGTMVKINNNSGGNTYIAAPIQGVNPYTLADGEGLSLYFNGSEWRKV